MYTKFCHTLAAANSMIEDDWHSGTNGAAFVDERDGYLGLSDWQPT